MKKPIFMILLTVTALCCCMAAPAMASANPSLTFGPCTVAPFGLNIVRTPDHTNEADATEILFVCDGLSSNPAASCYRVDCCTEDGTFVCHVADVFDSAVSVRVPYPAGHGEAGMTYHLRIQSAEDEPTCTKIRGYWKAE